MAKTKGSTQLSGAVEMMKAYTQPMSKADRAELLEKFRTKFECSKETAYYYYFYKAMKQLKAEGVEVSPAKTAVKKAKSTTVAEVVAGMPTDVQAAMTKKSPFAQLGV